MDWTVYVHYVCYCKLLYTDISLSLKWQWIWWSIFCSYCFIILFIWWTLKEWKTGTNGHFDWTLSMQSRWEYFFFLYVSSRSSWIVVDMTFNIKLKLSQNMICDIESKCKTIDIYSLLTHWKQSIRLFGLTFEMYMCKFV